MVLTRTIGWLLSIAQTAFLSDLASSWIGKRADYEFGFEWRHLQIRHIHFRDSARFQALVLHVIYNSNDLPDLIICHNDLNFLSKRISVGKAPAGQAPTDDDGSRRF